jgi:chromate reductase
MAKYNIAVVVGSLRGESSNRKLADAIVKLGPADFSVNRAEIADLASYN